MHSIFTTQEEEKKEKPRLFLLKTLIISFFLLTVPYSKLLILLIFFDYKDRFWNAAVGPCVEKFFMFMKTPIFINEQLRYHRQPTVKTYQNESVT